MRFEYDPAKSTANKAKHGIDFEEAQSLWDDERLVEAPTRTEEPRAIAIGQIAGQYWAAVFTWRGEAIRVISVRRARKEEVERYESQGS